MFLCSHWEEGPGGIATNSCNELDVIDREDKGEIKVRTHRMHTQKISFSKKQLGKNNLEDNCRDSLDQAKKKKLHLIIICFFSVLQTSNIEAFGSLHSFLFANIDQDTGDEGYLPPSLDKPCAFDSRNAFTKLLLYTHIHL